MSIGPKDLAGEKPLRVRRGRVDSVDLYEIKEHELDLFERGSPADLQLNFAIFLLSVAFTGICTLATATFANDDFHLFFMVVSVVGILLGAYLLIAWFRNRVSLKVVCKTIRARIPADLPLVEADTAPAESGR